MHQIYTLNARDHIFLSSVKSYYGLTEKIMRREIIALHNSLIDILRKKNIQYEKLKSSLTPRTDRYEAAFLFDTTQIQSSWYGYEVAEKILPIFNKESSHSILHGDLLGNNQQKIFGLIKTSTVLAQDFIFRHSNLIYCVYINNLTETMLNNFDSELKTYHPYIGYIPATFSSFSKTYLSTTLTNAFLKHKKTIILPHEDDRDNTGDINLIGYPFEKFGHTIRSISSLYFGIFLSFKIEREVFDFDEDDVRISLNAISETILDLDDFHIRLDDSKYTYIATNKKGKLKKAEIENISKEELQTIIKRQISSNYIYDMIYLEQYNTIQVNSTLQ